MKYKEVNEEYFDYVKGLKIKYYLTIEEINDIVDNCLAETDALKRMIILYTKCVEYATNIDLEQFVEDGAIDTAKVYNALAKEGYIEFVNQISNYHQIGEIINKTESLYNVFTKALNESDFDQEKLLNDMKDVINNFQVKSK